MCACLCVCVRVTQEKEMCEGDRKRESFLSQKKQEIPFCLWFLENFSGLYGHKGGLG